MIINLLVRLEDQGYGASKNNHFEQTIFGNEIMVASATKFNIISKFTLALIKDSGW